MVDQRTKKRVTQKHLDALEQNAGPIYGVSLIACLPIIGSEMMQAMPSRGDLEQVRKVSERTAAGYEVLLAHWREQGEQMKTLEQSWQDGHAAQEARHRDELERLRQEIRQLEATVVAGNTAISQLEQAVAHRDDCAKCQGTGQEHRSWNNDYIDRSTDDAVVALCDAIIVGARTLISEAKRVRRLYPEQSTEIRRAAGRIITRANELRKKATTTTNTA